MTKHVHVLRHGVTLCGTLPNRFRPGEKWTSAFEPKPELLDGQEWCAVCLGRWGAEQPKAAVSKCAGCNKGRPHRECPECELFLCSGCGRWVPWDCGAADGHPGLCDVCAAPLAERPEA